MGYEQQQYKELINKFEIRFGYYLASNSYFGDNLQNLKDFITGVRELGYFKETVTIKRVKKLNINWYGFNATYKYRCSNQAGIEEIDRTRFYIYDWKEFIECSDKDLIEFMDTQLSLSWDSDTKAMRMYKELMSKYEAIVPEEYKKVLSKHIKLEIA